MLRMFSKGVRSPNVFAMAWKRNMASAVHDDRFGSHCKAGSLPAGDGTPLFTRGNTLPLLYCDQHKSSAPYVLLLLEVSAPHNNAALKCAAAGPKDCEQPSSLCLFLVDERVQ